MRFCWRFQASWGKMKKGGSRRFYIPSRELVCFKIWWFHLVRLEICVISCSSYMKLWANYGCPRWKIPNGFSSKDELFLTWLPPCPFHCLKSLLFNFTVIPPFTFLAENISPFVSFLGDLLLRFHFASICVVSFLLGEEWEISLSKLFFLWEYLLEADIFKAFFENLLWGWVHFLLVSLAKPLKEFCDEFLYSLHLLLDVVFFLLLLCLWLVGLNFEALSHLFSSFSETNEETSACRKYSSASSIAFSKS